MNANNNLLYKDLAYKVVGCFYEVFNELGPAHKEQVYHEALKICFTPTPESPAIYGGDEWLSGSEFRPPKERRNYTEKKPRDLSRGVFTEHGIQFKDKARLKIQFKGEKVGIYEPDFIVEDKIIIEIKSLLNLPKVFEKQLYYYLRASKYKLGYLVNFGTETIDIRRRIYETARTKE